MFISLRLASNSSGVSKACLLYTSLEGTYLVWVDVRPSGLTSDEVTEKLLKEGRVQVNSGTMYGQTTGEGYVRINIACPRATLIEGLKRMVDVLK